MGLVRYDFLFLRFEGRVQVEKWCDFVIREVRNYGISPTLIGGSKSGWIKAPKGHEALIEKMISAKNHSLQAGANPHRKDAYDGWGVEFAMTNESSVRIFGFSEVIGSQDSLAEWARSCVKKLMLCGDVGYGFAYSGSFPKDGLFGLGMFAGKPSAGISSIFGNQDRVANWFRAEMWSTSRGYIFDVFPFNVVGEEFLNNALCGEKLEKALLKYGRIERLGCGLSAWLVDDEEKRAAISALLSQVNLTVASHKAGEFSQIRPAH